MEDTKPSSYETGEFNYQEHKKFYDHFKRDLAWSVLLGSTILLAFILMFATPVSWFWSLFVSLIVGVLAGVLLSMKSIWYLTLFVLWGFGIITSLIILLIQSFI